MYFLRVSLNLDRPTYWNGDPQCTRVISTLFAVRNRLHNCTALLLTKSHLSLRCWSYVGRHGGPQIVSLQPPDDTGANCLGTDGRPIHELLHALGVFHEQSRYDRDNFVKINIDNIIPRALFGLSLLLILVYTIFTYCIFYTCCV